MTIKSRPIYDRLKIDPSGRRHLLLVGSAEGPSPEAFAPSTDAAEFEEQWRIVSNSLAIPDPDKEAAQLVFRSESHLLIALKRRLEEERMGLRLYAIGTEPFLWNVRGVAAGFGMASAEVHLYAVGTAARRVFCNHCRTITERVTTNVFGCSGCGAHLFVRDHFSRRINAFAGVQVDAEVPGELPPVEELYS
jgi:dimethylamine monooxygenase subunit C